jgi:hypothetical protein
MQPIKVTTFAAIFAAIATLFASLYGFAEDKPSKFLVRFIATSTVVRSAWSGNQDVYLMKLKPKSGDTQFLAKLVDEYPSWGSAIPRSSLLLDTSLFRLKRNSGCDPGTVTCGSVLRLEIEMRPIL